MSLPPRCGRDCVIPPDPESVGPLSISVRPEGAWVVDGDVVRSIADGGHDAGHPFYLGGETTTLEKRGDLLRRLMSERPAHVLPVEAVCQCSYRSPLLAGKPIQDFALAGDGYRLISPHERRIDWPPAVLQHLLAQLTSGLSELHQLGLAHGDPALMNAYVDTAEAPPLGIWIDLNSVRTASEAAVAVDVAGFELTSLWPALLDSRFHSRSLFDDLLSAAAQGSDPLDAYREILEVERHDHTEGGAAASLLEALAVTDTMFADDLFGRTRRRLASAMSPLYFLAQTRSDQTARFFSATLEAERTRHLLLEEERTRLHGIRYLDEIATLNSRIQEIDSDTRAALEGAHEALDGLRTELSNERAFATELGNEKARLANALNDIYLSRAWRTITRARRAARLPSRLANKLRVGRGATDTVETPAATHLLAASAPPVQSYPYLVSVIMPVFNKGATLRASIDSVRAQTLGAVEILIWDDGSTDPKTLAVLDEVGELPDVAMFRAPNQGVVGARNSAIALSRGRYICCLDPDDQIAPTYLEQAVALLESQPEYAITYPWVHSTGAVDELWQTHDLEPSLITRANHVPVCAVVRREVFEETGGFSDEMVHGYEDWELWVHAAELGFRGKAIPAHHLKYRIDHDPNSSRDASAKEIHQDLVDEIARLHPRLAKTGVPMQRPTAMEVRPVGAELGPRRLPPGSGRPVVLTLPWFTVGGADKVVETLVRHWVGDGRTVVVFMTTPLAPGMSNRSHALEGITPYVYPLNDFLPPRQWYEFFATTVAALDSPVMLNVGSAWFYESAKAVRRDFPQIRIVDQQFNPIAHLPGNQKIAGLVDLTIAAYEGLAHDLASDGRDSEVEPVYVAVHPPAAPTDREVDRFRERAGLHESERFVLFVGRLADEKRPEWIARLAEELQPDEARVVMIGDGPLRQDVIEAVDSNQRLVWIPEVDAVEPAIAAADLLALPSKIEGIPLVALEALALGTPLVATRVGGLPDLEGEAGVNLADPDDFDAFVEAVRKVLNGNRGNVRLSGRFSESAMLASYDRLLFDSD